MAEQNEYLVERMRVRVRSEPRPGDRIVRSVSQHVVVRHDVVETCVLGSPRVVPDSHGIVPNLGLWKYDPDLHGLYGPGAGGDSIPPRGSTTKRPYAMTPRGRCKIVGSSSGLPSTMIRSAADPGTGAVSAPSPLSSRLPEVAARRTSSLLRPICSSRRSSACRRGPIGLRSAPVASLTPAATHAFTASACLAEDAIARFIACSGHPSAFIMSTSCVTPIVGTSHAPLALSAAAA